MFGLGGKASIIIGGLIIFTFALVALLAPVISPYDPLHQDRQALRQPPIWAQQERQGEGVHLLGTDFLGRDVLSRVIWGSRVSLAVGLGAELLALVMGILVGALAGYARPWVDNLWMRITDVFFAFPGILLAIAILAVFERPGVGGLIFALGLTAWPPIARVVRAQMLALREQEFVLAARAMGASPIWIVVRHLLPGCVAPVTVLATVGVAGAILGEAGLSFLGLGIAPPWPSWGGMLAEGRSYLTIYPWISVFPGLALALTVLGFNLLGDGLRDLLDPRGLTRSQV